jgi:hypothetical protein
MERSAQKNASPVKDPAAAPDSLNATAQRQVQMMPAVQTWQD